MLDADIAALLGEPAAAPPLTVDLIGPMRAGMAAAAGALPGVDLAEVRDLDGGGVPVRLYRPASETALPLLVFYHGGGWFLGDLDTHDSMYRNLAARANCAMLAVDYRLAPESPFPAGLDDAATALSWARERAAEWGCDADRIAIGGESAGGNLAAALALRLRDAGQPQPLFQLLIHPVTDLDFAGVSIREVAVPGLSQGDLEAMRTFYVAGADHRHPLISPLHAADHGMLAPAIVLTAAEDPLRDDGEAYAAALVRAGVETLAARLPGLPHGFLFLPVTIPAVSRAYDLIARLVRRYFHRA